MKPRQARKDVKRITVGYVRVSTDDQGASLEAQEARIRAYAAALELDVSEIIRDAGESAKSLQRPGMTRIIAGVRNGAIGRVIALKLDRLTRSTRDLADLLALFSKADAALVSVSEHLDTLTASGRMVVGMLGVVAQWEREAIAERTSFALAHKRRTRQVYGPTPFGYRRDGNRLVRDDEQQGLLMRIRAMRAEGQSVRRVCAWLNQNAVLTPRGSRVWYPNTLHQVLHSKAALEAAS